MINPNLTPKDIPQATRDAAKVITENHHLHWVGSMIINAIALANEKKESQ